MSGKGGGASASLPTARPVTADEWLSVANLVLAWADEMRAGLDAKGGGRHEWTAWDLLDGAAARLFGVAAGIAANEHDQGKG